MPIPKPPTALEFLLGRSRPGSRWVITPPDFHAWRTGAQVEDSKPAGLVGAVRRAASRRAKR